MTTTPAVERSEAGMVHEAMPSRDEAQLLTGTVGYIRAALERDQPVLVALPPDRTKRVRDRLGADASRVRFDDICEEGRNPARIIPGLLRPFVDEHPGRRTVIVAEPMWPGRSAAAYASWVEHEALLNLAFAEVAVSIVCLCDLAVLPEHTLVDLERTHPAVRENHVTRVSGGYVDPAVVVETISALRPQAPADADRFEFPSVSEARRVAAEWARSSGLTSDRLTDVLIAVSEVSGNSVEHAGAGGTMLCWRDAGSLVYEIRDRGHIRDLLAGRLPPPPEQESGRGLLMVNLLCDLVQITSGPSGTVIRLWMTLPAP